MLRTYRTRGHSALALFAGLVRWREWYSSKFPLFLACIAYAAFARPAPDRRLLLEMFGLVAILFFYGSYGHLANDLSDRVADRIAGKPNLLASFAGQLAWLLVSATAVLGAGLAAAFFYSRPDVVIVIIAAFALAGVYSLPPVRLKERGALGLVAAAAAQRTMPAVVIFQALDAWSPTAVALCLLSTFIGLRYILIHQMIDAGNDQTAGLQTFGTARSRQSLSRIIIWRIFPFEMASLAAVVACVVVGQPYTGAILAAYFPGLAVRLKMRKGMGIASSPTHYTFLFDFYFVYLPLVASVALSFRDATFLPFTALTIVWVFPLLRRELRQIHKLTLAYRLKWADVQARRRARRAAS